jgi:hypothetical protein
MKVRLAEWARHLNASPTALGHVQSCGPWTQRVWRFPAWSFTRNQTWMNPPLLLRGGNLANIVLDRCPPCESQVFWRNGTSGKERGTPTPCHGYYAVGPAARKIKVAADGQGAVEDQHSGGPVGLAGQVMLGPVSKNSELARMPLATTFLCLGKESRAGVGANNADARSHK